MTSYDNNEGITSGTITVVNQDESQADVDLNIVKVEKDKTDKTLEGASFRVTLLDEDQTTAERVVSKTSQGSPVFSQEFGPTDKDGKITVAGLTSGYYMVEESHAPEGYVISGEDPTFYIHVQGGSIDYLIRSMEPAEKDKKLAEWNKSDTGSGLVKYDKEQQTATVENTPGAELPSAGGIGTTIFYILGSLLVIGSAVVLISRRRIRK